MVALLVVLGVAVGVAGGLPHLALLRASQPKVSLVLVATVVSLLCLMGILALAAHMVGGGVVYFAGALTLAFLGTVSTAVLTAKNRA